MKEKRLNPDAKPVVVDGLFIKFGGLQALRDVSFSVEKGQRLVIIGPNGAGKTTLFNLITGEIPPSDGRVYLFGRDVTYFPPHRRTHLGMARTFQITNLFPNLTLYENILLAVVGVNHQRYKMHRSVTAYDDMTARIEALIDQWDLQEHKYNLVKNLSYGVQRQIEVIMALAGGSEILLLDEPTSGLSPAETVAVTSMILHLDPKVTLLIIEHDMDVAFELAHHMIVLHLGEVIAEGAPEEIRLNSKVKEIYLGEE